MSDSATTLLTMFAGEWQEYQHAVSDALAPLTPEQLALRAAPDLRSIGELACHIIGTRAGWFCWVLDAGDEEFKAYEQWHKPTPGSAPKTASELVDGLAATWQVMQQTMASYTLADLREEITRERGGRTRVFTRGWVIWHVMEHDLHHGGEISLTLGMHGLHAPDI
ncbi:MAG TPA: DinB family protein [Ktedonobacterales bacterium]|jgi:uncharacterized damage-inducible protein DinB